MKNLIYFISFLTSGILFSCNQPQYNADQTADSTLKAAIKDQCYRAISEADTANLTIRTAADGKVTGELEMRYGLKPNAVERVINNGKVDGSFRGDTLFLNYLYTSGALNRTLYQNPLALLKDGEKLALGVGEIETSVGRSYFVKNKPIDFGKGRFKFNPTECK
ncbi:MAG: hypothetical protein H7096_04235 [Flavobacterium sp.]|nr:hypothetical protein [Pedobacter sp.]